MSRYSQAEKELMSKLANDLYKEVIENKSRQSSVDNKATENLDTRPDDVTNGTDAMVDTHFIEPSRPMNVKKDSTVME
jgi:hypothetical protein